MAHGILCASSGVSGIIMPFANEVMLQKYGYPTTLRVIAVALAVLTGPLIPLLKGRLPPTEHSALQWTDWTFLKKPLFWVYCTSNLAQGLGYFFPSLYLPSYATAIVLRSTQGALLLALLSVSQVLGQFSFGYLSDHQLPLNSLIVMPTLMSAVASLTL
jgi:predicted MFS family arabinose efflux permease